MDQREAKHLVDGYLASMGLAGPSDAAMLIQVTLLRQWTAHLARVLEDEGVPDEVAERVVRGMVYGGAPNLAEAQFRHRMTEQMTAMAAHVPAGTVLPWT